MGSSEKVRDRTATIICLIIGTILFAYVFERALKISITHDEAFSWNNVAGHSIMEIISCNTSPGMGPGPNNHILNTLFMKFFGWVFGPSVFALRLQSLLAYLFFLIFSFLICKRMKNPILVVSGFLLLSIDPYVLQFFGLARGYGLANAFMLGTIYFLLEWKEKKDRRNLIFVFLFGCLSVISNFSLLQFYVGVLIVVNYIFLFEGKNNFKTLFLKNRWPLFFTISLAAIIFEPLRKIIKWKQTFGGSIGFWHDTVGSEIQSAGTNSTYWLWVTPILEILIISISVLIVAAILKSVLKKEWATNATILGLLLFIPIIIHIAEHSLFGNEFLTGRTAQYFIPLFFLSFIFSADYILARFSFILPLIIASLGVAHLVNVANLSHTSDWLYDCDNKKVLEYIQTNVLKNNSSHIHLGNTWIYEPGLNFYRISENMNWLDPVKRGYSDGGSYDLYYVLWADTTGLQKQGKQILKKFPLSDSYLMK